MNTELRAGLGLGRIPFVALGLLLALFLLLPMLVVVPTSWTSGALIEFPPELNTFVTGVVMPFTAEANGPSCERVGGRYESP